MVTVLLTASLILWRCTLSAISNPSGDSSGSQSEDDHWLMFVFAPSSFANFNLVKSRSNLIGILKLSRAKSCSNDS